MSEIDSFALNIQGVQDLVESDINKTANGNTEEVGELTDEFELKMTDAELLALRDEWQRKHDGYYPKIKPRTEQNKIYYAGSEYKSGLQSQKGVASNLIFEAQETFIPQALAKNPEPVVWSDNTPEGMEASNQIKAMLQYKADTMGMRKKLGVTLRKWSIYFTGIVKHGWNSKDNDFETTVRKPQNFVFDPDAYVDEMGRYIGDFLGEKCTVTAKKLIDMFEKQKDYITLKVDGKLGTKVTYTEWWTDQYCFYTFEDVVLDKHKNQFFNYPNEQKNSEEDQERYGMEPVTVTPGKNHFAIPMMPYSFLSVFTLQEQPHDITNLIEQAIPNQDRVIDRDFQISKNLRAANNSIAMSGQAFDKETARQGAQALEDGDPVLVPNGDVERGIKRFPAPPLPNGLLESQQEDKQMLRQLFGTYGITPQQATSETTARGQILNQDQDSSRIGGGVGEALEQLADNIFNWWLQMMHVFYDEPHYGAILGMGKSVEYVQIINSNLNRQFVVSVSPNSMSPKDEISLQNMALQLWQEGALDPLTLMKMFPALFPDPNQAAQMLLLYKTNPAQYAQMLGVPAVQPPMGAPGGQAQEQGQPPPTMAGNPPSSGALSEVPIKTP